MTDNKRQSESPKHWSSGSSFILVAAGLAIGLGNLWRFPFLAGQYGGGAFVLAYVLAVLIFGIPIMIAEILVGRRGGGSPDQSVQALRRDAGAPPFWNLIGWLSVIIPFVGIAYYSVVAGWVVDYLVDFVGSGGFERADPGDYQARFNDMLNSPARVLAGHSAFMLLVGIVAAKGINSGLERMAKLLMPALFILIIGLAAHASVTGDFKRAVEFLFRPDFSKLTSDGLAAAAGQAFFSLGVGLGALMTFGAYLPPGVSIPRVAGAVALADTAIALIAGLAIFPITFALGVDPAAGPGLIFVSMPAAFAMMPAGYFVGSAFFILLFIAAFTTGVATIEPVIAWLERRGAKRTAAAAWATAAAWLVGVAAALSFNVWSDIRPLGFIPAFADRSIFDTLDFSIATIFLPLNGLLAALFVGWALSKDLTRAEAGLPQAAFTLWRFAIRFLAPAFIIGAVWLQAGG